MHEREGQTDGRTDRQTQTQHDSIGVVRIASRGKNKKKFTLR